MKNIIKEFKEFAIKGNVFDMAVGIIIGTAFSKVVSSLVADIITPFISYFTGEVDFKNLSITLRPEQIDENGTLVQQLVSINYGNFLQNTIDFLIIALCIFAVIKVFNSLKRKAENVEDKTVSTPKDIELLTEIRDLLKRDK